ncbi:MAG: hypothetical protein ACOYEP_04410 [Limnochordia bacterium]
MRINSGVPTALQAAIDANAELKEALIRIQMPRRFQAMVLGLTALGQINRHQRTSRGERWPQSYR